MKFSHIFLILALLVPVHLYSQDTAHVVVPRSALTREQLKSIETQNELHSIGDWAGWGKEIGEAVNSSLQAISSQAVEFAKTDVGKVTIKIVMWKLLGPMVVHVIGGFLVLLIGVPSVIWLISRNAVNRKIITREDKDGTKYYEIFTPSSDAKVGYTITLFAMLILVATVTFTW